MFTMELYRFRFGRRWCITYPNAIMEFFYTKRAALAYQNKYPYVYVFRHGIRQWHLYKEGTPVI